MPSDLDIAALLSELGFGSPEALGHARHALVEAGLTTPKKQRIDASKRPRIEALLQEHFLVICGEAACAAHAAGRTLLPAATPNGCSVCGGSANRRALQGAREGAKKAGLTRFVVVGGSPPLHDELRRMAPPEWSLRIVDGTLRRTADQARGDLDWAHLVLIWGSTELDHKVSELYTVHRDARCITFNRRSLAALFDVIAEHTRRRRPR